MKIPLLFGLLLGAYSDMALSEVTHCKDQEKIVFNCRVENSNKIISVCEISQNNNKQYLQYAFGELGKIELLYPKTGRVNKNQFTFEHGYSDNSGWRQHLLKFTIGKYNYEIFWQELSGSYDDRKDKPEISSGVHVQKDYQQAVFSCDKSMESGFVPSHLLQNVKQVNSE